MTPQASPNRTTLTWLVPITLLVAVCALVGGLIARQVYEVTKPVSTGLAPATSSAPESTPASALNDDKTVHFTDFAKADPQFGKVQNAIQGYFNATNLRDYNQFRATMTSRVLAQQTQQDWINGLKSTHDYDMNVYRIEATDQGADVFGSFISKQDPKDAPKELPVDCIVWRMVWPMVAANGGLRIDVPSINIQKCP